MSITAVFGGTFNPFHIGHYEILKCLCEQNWIEKVLVLPDKIPPHKVCDYMPLDTDRIEMCKIVCEDFEKAELSLIEFEREGKSFTVDTITLLKKRYPNDKFAFVCGGDMIATLDEWHEWENLITQTAFIAFSRNDSAEFKESVERMRSLGADIRVIDTAITDISSSMLRQTVNKDFIPPKVYDYIIKRKIYDEKNYDRL